VSREAGVTFIFDDCRKGMATMMEQAGPGCAVFDYDNDGWPDLYFPNGRDRYGRGQVRRNALYHNNRDGTFTDVTDRAGVPGTGYGTGVAAADYDNDGYTDLYVCQYGKNALYHNERNGTFKEVTDEAGVTAMENREPFHTGAAWVDYDRDGKLDLFVCGYVAFEKGPRYCELPGSRQLTNCPPSMYPGTHCLLYHNEGGGKFRNVTKQTGAWISGSKGLTAIACDYNSDGWPDLFVGNDGSPAYLLKNEQGQRFREVGFASGVALTQEGRTMAAMGVDLGDYKNDGKEALFVADFQDKPNHLFELAGPEVFMEVTDQVGIGAPALGFLGFGGGFVDYDNDGWLDLFVANGHVYPEIDTLGQAARYRQHNQLFRNRRDGTFEETTEKSGPGFNELNVGRGAVWADLWNRGGQDIVVAQNGGRPLILKHSGRGSTHFLSLRLAGMTGNRDAIGARVMVVAGGVTQSRTVRTSYSYLSSGETRLHFGLGGATTVEKVEVAWPGGTRSTYTRVPADGYYLAVEGDNTLQKQPIQPATPPVRSNRTMP
jgi:enediyne biosynthesis protein E4